jgi:hypothetical protein
MVRTAFDPEYHITNVASWEREFPTRTWRFVDVPMIKSYKDIYPGMCCRYNTDADGTEAATFGGFATKFRSALALTYESIICLRHSNTKNVLTRVYDIYYGIAKQATSIYSVSREPIREEFFLDRLIHANDKHLWLLTIVNCFHTRLDELKAGLQQEDPEVIKLMELELAELHEALASARMYLTYILAEELEYQRIDAERRTIQRRLKPIKIEYGLDDQSNNVPMTMKTTKVTNFQVVSLEYSGIGEDQELVATIRLPLKGVSLEHVYNRKRVSRSITQPSTQSSNGSRAQSRSIDI